MRRTFDVLRVPDDPGQIGGGASAASPDDPGLRRPPIVGGGLSPSDPGVSGGPSVDLIPPQDPGIREPVPLEAPTKPEDFLATQPQNLTEGRRNQTLANLGISELPAELAAVRTAQVSGRSGYASQAALFGDLSPAANTLAEVVGDPTQENDGVYRKIGAENAGSWEKSTADVTGRLKTVEDGDDGYSGRHWVLLDNDGNIISAYNQAGELECAFPADSIPNKALQLLPYDTSYSGYDLISIDLNGLIISGTYTNGIDINNPVFPDLSTPAVPSMGLVGDSTSNQTYDTQLAALTGGVVNEYGWPGEKSNEIIGRFLLRSATEDIMFFWIGQNDEVDHVAGSVMYHFNQALADLPEGQRWLVSSPHPRATEVRGSEPYIQKELARDTLARLYPDRFVDLWGALIYDYDYGGFELEVDFVQPAIDANVSITLNKTTNLLTYASGWGSDTPPDSSREHAPTFYLGALGEVDDLYEVISVDSATTITAKRISGSTATGATIANATEASGFPVKKRFIQSLDAAYYNDGIPPRSLMSDPIHPGVRGNQIIANTLHNKTKTLNWI